MDAQQLHDFNNRFLNTNASGTIKGSQLNMFNNDLIDFIVSGGSSSGSTFDPTSLSTAISQEVSDRISGDTSLKTLIDNIPTFDPTSLSTSISNETSDRISGDTSLKTEIDGKVDLNAVTQTITGDLVLNGNFIVSGSTITLSAQTLEVQDNFILVNYGEPGHGISLGQAGLQIDRGLEPDYFFEFKESSQTFRVGESGQTQAVATRPDSPDDGGYGIWDAALNMFITSTGITGQVDNKVDKLGYGSDNDTMINNFNYSSGISGYTLQYDNIGLSGSSYLQLNADSLSLTKFENKAPFKFSQVYLFDDNIYFNVKGENAFRMYSGYTEINKIINYKSDLSSSYTDRTLVDKAYADTKLGSNYTFYSGNNTGRTSFDISYTGLTMHNDISNHSTSSTIVNGGTPIIKSYRKNTPFYEASVIVNGAIPTIYNNVKGTFYNNSYQFGDYQLTIMSTNNTGHGGVVYDRDISGSYTDRTLVDKGYIDSRFSNYTPSASYTALSYTTNMGQYVGGGQNMGINIYSYDIYGFTIVNWYGAGTITFTLANGVPGKTTEIVIENPDNLQFPVVFTPDSGTMYMFGEYDPTKKNIINVTCSINSAYQNVYYLTIINQTI